MKSKRKEENVMKNSICLVIGLLMFSLTLGAAVQTAQSADAMPTSSDVKVLLDNDTLKVSSVKRHPGTKVPIHTHKPYIAYFPGPWEGRFTSPEGKTAEKGFKAGDLICSPKGKTHALEIIGSDDQLVLVVEFKALPEIDCTGQKAKE